MRYLIIILFSFNAYSGHLTQNVDHKGKVMAIEYMSKIWNNYRHSGDVAAEIKEECGENYYILTDDNDLNDSANKTLKTAIRHDSGNSVIIYRCMKSANLSEIYSIVYQ